MKDDNQIKKLDLNKVDWRGSKDFFQSLEDELRNLDDKDEKYDFTWVGKRKAIIEAGAPINKTFRPDVENSKNWDTTENLFIEGDNLDALKLLQESYLGKVKMIYIDPPYNTGKDFVYHDNFKANTEVYDEAIEYKDEEGNIQFKKNEKSNGRYHSDWLSMMYPRLKLARNLLTEDGVIFISIDDNELANLIRLSDEVFGEDNFIANFIWEKTFRPSNFTKTVRKNTEYILCYSKTSSVEMCGVYEDSQGDFSLTKKKHNEKILNCPANYVIANFDDGMYSKGNYGSGYELLDDIVVENNMIKNEFRIKIAMSIWGQSYLDEEIKKGVTLIVKNKKTMALYARKSYQQNEQKTTSLLPNEKVGDVLQSNAEVAHLIGKEYFDYPKPTSLITYLLKIVKHDKEDIILDFFSGSGTTAHAAILLNAEDEGNRKWIMVQLPEVIPEDSVAFKAGYKTIPELARERIRRAGDKIAKDNPETKVDYGFRSLVISDTNFKDVYKSAGEVTQGNLLEVVDNIKDDRTELDLLYGVLSQLALELNRPLETRDIAGSAVYLYDYFSEVSGLIACFANNVSEETIKQIASLKPLTAVFRDSSFVDSQAKVNLAEHFRIISPDTRIRVI